MKNKLILISSILIVLLVVTACQSTPDENVVSQKNQNEMIEAASNNDNGEQESKETTFLKDKSLPKSFSDSFSSSDSKLVVNVDAEITVPKVDEIPIYKVKSSGFSEEYANDLYKLLCGNTDMYFATQSFTKEAIMDEILEQKRQLQNNEISQEARVITEEYIERLQKDYQSAPDSMGTPIESVSFNTRQNHKMPYSFFEVTENTAGQGGKYFSVKNDPIYENEAVKNIDGKTFAPHSNAYITFYDFNIKPEGELYEIREIMGEEIIDELNISPSQAQKKVNDLLENIGIDNMEIYSICLMSNIPNASSSSDAKYGYNIKLHRIFDGVSITSPEYSTYVDDPSYGFQWDYEIFNIGLNDEGIYSFYHKAPLAIKDTIVDEAMLLNFNDIMVVFNNMMFIANEPESHIAEEYSSITFEISNITLSLQRISEQNSVTNGLLVPVWNFYGEKIYTYTNGSSYKYSDRVRAECPEGAGGVENIYYPFLSINAVDGSIINPQRGY